MEKENFENLYNRIENFEKELQSITKIKNTGINIFDAIGMKRQEIKHSAFMAWLLNPNKEHKLSTQFIKMFLKRLALRENGEEFEDNAKILKNLGIDNTDINQFFEDAQNVSVETERSLTKETIDDGRIDIYVEDKKNKVLIAIENKVFTSTHDNQLLRYEEEFCDRTDWKKIFVYLSPFGELPKDDNGLLCYNWCVMDYRDVLSIIRQLKDNQKPISNKLKLLMGDYIDMVETNILKEKKELIKLCKQIRRKYQEELDILLQYTGEENIEYVKNSFKKNIVGTVVKETESGISGYSAKIQSFFAQVDKTSNFNFAYNISCIKGPMQAKISIYKEENEQWTTAQKKLKDIISPNIRAGNKYCSMVSIEILTEEEVCLPLEKVRTKLDKKLAEFYDKVNYLENNI